jgi:type IV pilus assembly protein PilA
MINKIKTRLASEEGFTLIELLVVIIILGILVAIAVPAYLSFRGSAQQAAAKSNVRSALPAAESFYQANVGTATDADSDASTSGYQGLTGAQLRTQAPGVSPNVKAVVLNGGNGYCVEDTEPNNQTFSYIGGDAGTDIVSPAVAATIQQGDCATTTGVSGAA